MRILQVSTSTFADPRYYRSNELALSSSLVKLGHDVTIFTANKSPKWQMLDSTSVQPALDTIEGITIRRFPAGPELPNHSITPTMFNAILKQRCDVVHTHRILPPSSFYAALACKMKQRPLILTEHDYMFGSTHGLKLFAYALYGTTIGRFVTQSASAIIGISSTALKFVHNFGAGGGKSVLIPSSVDTTLFRPNQKSLLTTWAPEIGRPVVLYVGRLKKSKGVEYLLRAFSNVAAQIPGAHLVILGRGPDEFRLKNIRTLLRLRNVHFLGRLPRNQMPYVYPGCDLFVLPSTFEPFGNVVLEAMASGLPVVGTDTGGMSDTIEHRQTGFHMQPGDVEQLSRFMTLLLTDRKLKLQMARAARLAAEKKYDDMVIAKSIEKAYERCLNV